ncbi:hypothetical protein MPTK2_8g18370 [Marchantia polymorpha subsp. ruderalis]
MTVMRCFLSKISTSLHGANRETTNHTNCEQGTGAEEVGVQSVLARPSFQMTMSFSAELRSCVALNLLRFPH